MIEVKNVSKSYNGKNKVVDNINFSVKNGEIFGFLGPNGAGKSTTIKMMTGILGIDTGKILIDGCNIKTQGLEAKKRFGYVPDNADMFLKLTAIEYLNFMADIYNVDEEERKNVIKKLADIFEISKSLNEKIESFSHGMRQKVAIIGALLHNPDNLIIDEPMTGLDPKSTYELKKIMRKITKKNNAVFFSTHILDVAEKLCDKIGIINNGKILFVGTLEQMRNELKENKSLEELFMEITEND